MTNEEAREILEKLIPQPQRGDGKSITHLMITEALTMAIKALEQTDKIDEDLKGAYDCGYNCGYTDALNDIAESEW